MHKLQTLRDKYHTDVHFNSLVQMLTSQIHQGNFTPSELREACFLASLCYEETRVHNFRTVSPEGEMHLDALRKLADASPYREG